MASTLTGQALTGVVTGLIASPFAYRDLLRLFLPMVLGRQRRPARVFWRYGRLARLPRASRHRAALARLPDRRRHVRHRILHPVGRRVLPERYKGTGPSMGLARGRDST